MSKIKKKHKFPKDRNNDNINPTILCSKITDLIKQDKYTYNQICAAFDLTKKIIKGSLIMQTREQSK